MGKVGSILGVPGNKGMFIGRVVDAYINYEKGELVGVLCQLIGNPTRLLYYPVHDGVASVDAGKIMMGPLSIPSWKTPEFFGESRDFNNLMRLRGIEIYNEDKQFLGLLDDFALRPNTMLIEKLYTTGGEEIVLEENDYYIDHYEGRRHLIVQPAKISSMESDSRGILNAEVILEEAYKFSDKEKVYAEELDVLDEKWKQKVVNLELNYV